MSHNPELSVGALVHNPTYPCSCWIKRDGNTERIVYCPTHAAAPELLAALKRAYAYCPVEVQDDVLTPAIRKAEG